MPCSRQFPGQVGLPLRGLGAGGRPAAPSTCGCLSALSTPHVPPARPSTCSIFSPTRLRLRGGGAEGWLALHFGGLQGMLLNDTATQPFT